MRADHHKKPPIPCCANFVLPFFMFYYRNRRRKVEKMSEWPLIATTNNDDRLAAFVFLSFLDQPKLLVVLPYSLTAQLTSRPPSTTASLHCLIKIAPPFILYQNSPGGFSRFKRREVLMAHVKHYKKTSYTSIRTQKTCIQDESLWLHFMFL